MFIQTEQTPNPATLKFLPGREVLGDATAHFASVDQADRSPLAKSLFDADGVAAVFLGSDFITITAEDGADWQDLKPAILGIIMEHFTAGLPVMEGEAEPQAGTADAGEDSELVTQIKDLLETRVRPAVAQDGGDIIFDRFDSGVVYLQMQGACSGCPSSTATLKHGIENLLKHFIPEVEKVRPV